MLPLRGHRRDRRLRPRARLRGDLPADPAQSVPRAPPRGHRPALLRDGGFRPEDSYGTCGVVAPDPKLLFDAFAAGLRPGTGGCRGRLPADHPAAAPEERRRVHRLQPVDPAGNWIRVIAGAAIDEAAPARRTARPRPGRRRRAGDSHGDVDQAAKILGGAVRRHSADAPPGERVEALAYLPELASAAATPAEPARSSTRIDALDLSGADRSRRPPPLGVVGRAPGRRPVDLDVTA